MSKQNQGHGNIHPKERRSWNDGKGVAKQLVRIQRRDARKQAKASLSVRPA